MGYSTEILRRVFDDDSGEYIEVGPSPDFPGNVILQTHPGNPYFGEIRIDLPAEFMEGLGKAILDCCKEIKNEA